MIDSRSATPLPAHLDMRTPAFHHVQQSRSWSSLGVENERGDVIKLRQVGLLLLACSGMASAQQGASTAASPGQSPPASSANEPTLKPRPRPTPGSPQGRIQLDILVTTKQGSPVAGLDPKDFIILDNKKAQSILSFRPIDVVPQNAEPEAQVILLLDLLNASFEQASVVALQMTKYLQQNGGHVADPTSIAVVSDQGVRLQPTPSTDGNQLAAQLNATMRTLGPAAARVDEVTPLPVISKDAVVDRRQSGQNAKSQDPHLAWFRLAVSHRIELLRIRPGPQAILRRHCRNLNQAARIAYIHLQHPVGDCR